MHKYFSHHIPRISQIIFRAVKTPIILYFAIFGNILVFASAWIFLQHELNVNDAVNNYFDAIWWAISTVTTVGYGDVVPVSLTGKVTGIILMVTGVVLFVTFTAVFASIITALTTEEEIESDYKKILKELKEIKKKLD